MLHGKWELRLQMELRLLISQETTLDYPVQAQGNHKSSANSWKQKGSQSQREYWRCCAAGRKDGGRAVVKDWRQPVKARKGKETVLAGPSPLDPGVIWRGHGVGKENLFIYKYKGD